MIPPDLDTENKIKKKIYGHHNLQNIKKFKMGLNYRLRNSDHLEGCDREGGREMQEGGDMGIYVYI